MSWRGGCSPGRVSTQRTQLGRRLGTTLSGWFNVTSQERLSIHVSNEYLCVIWCALRCVCACPDLTVAVLAAIVARLVDKIARTVPCLSAHRASWRGVDASPRVGSFGGPNVEVVLRTEREGTSRRPRRNFPVSHWLAAGKRQGKGTRRPMIARLTLQQYLRRFTNSLNPPHDAELLLHFPILQPCNLCFTHSPSPHLSK